MPPPPHPRRRRALATPAVCPCEGIAPAPLLASLVALAADVAGRGGDAAAFPALRRAAGRAVRVAGLLLAFLEVALDANVPAVTGGAAVLGLSELHVALQKLRFLLADCGGKGARLWVLMNAELVASELRVALGSVATAMDVLPRDSGEAGELAKLVSERALRVAEQLQPDPEDDRAARGVRSALAGFAGGVAPDAEDAWRVLRRVGADTWSGCCEEVAFLEAELLDRLETAGGENDNDLVLISGLMAFTVYCRVVLFDRIDDRKKKADVAAATSRPASSAAWIRSPEALQCPISLELMTDPVTVATGQTYDRASIKKWIKNNGCRTCPVTGEPLRRAEFVPNLAVRGIIEQLRVSKGVAVSLHHEPNSKHRCAVDQTAAPFGAAAAGGARLAAVFLVSKLAKGAPDEQKKATYEARKLSKRNVFYRARLVDAGAVPWLLHLLTATDAAVQDNAVAGLLNLSKHPAGRRALVVAGGVGLVVDAVNVAAKAEARQNAAAVLFYLSSNPEYGEEVGRVPEAIPALVRLARDGAYRGRKNALVSLYGLLQFAGSHGKAVSAGAVAVLAGLLPADDGHNDLAVALLARLAEQPVGARAVMTSPALVSRVVEFLGEAASRSVKEQCVALLAALGRHGGDRVLALLGELPGLMPALYALIADGSPWAGKKARWLVNEIHRHFEQRQAPAAAPAPPVTAADRVIRV